MYNVVIRYKGKSGKRRLNSFDIEESRKRGRKVEVISKVREHSPKLWDCNGFRWGRAC